MSDHKNPVMTHEERAKQLAWIASTKKMVTDAGNPSPGHGAWVKNQTALVELLHLRWLNAQPGAVQISEPEWVWALPPVQ